MPSMSERIQFIRDHVQADIEAAKVAPMPVHEGTGPAALGAWNHRRLDWEEDRELAAENAARLNLARWLGRPPTHSETTMFSRAYAEGARLGHWVKFVSSGKCWALQLPEDPSDG